MVCNVRCLVSQLSSDASVGANGSDDGAAFCREGNPAYVSDGICSVAHVVGGGQ